MKVNKELKQANEKLKEISNDEQLERLAWWRYKAILEENTARSEGLKRGIEKGIKQGIEKGIKQSIHQVIINMLKNGIDINIIKNVTGTSEKEIENIKKQIHGRY